MQSAIMKDCKKKKLPKRNPTNRPHILNRNFASI